VGFLVRRARASCPERLDGGSGMAAVSGLAAGVVVSRQSVLNVTNQSPADAGRVRAPGPNRTFFDQRTNRSGLATRFTLVFRQLPEAAVRDVDLTGKLATRERAT